MAQKSWPWSTVAALGDGAVTLSEAISREFLAAWFGVHDVAVEGVSKGVGGELAVTGAASPLAVASGSGICYGLYINDAATTTPAITTPAVGTTGGRVVLQTNWGGTGGAGLEARTRIAVKKSADGVAAIPALTQVFGTTWEISLATFTITTGGVITPTDARVFRKSTMVVDAAELAALAVTTPKLALLAVTTAIINDLAVTTGKLADLAVTSAKLGALSVIAGKIADGAVDTAARLAANVVTTAKILDANVTTAKLALLSVTAAVLADNAVTSVKILDGNVTTAKIDAQAVTNSRLADLAVGTSKLADNSVTTTKVANGVISAAAQIADGVITGAKLVAGTLTDTQVAAGGLTKTSLVNRTRSVFIPAQPGSLALQEVTAHGVDLPDATTALAMGLWAIPTDFVSGLTIKPVVYISGASGNLRWSAAAEKAGNGANMSSVVASVAGTTTALTNQLVKELTAIDFAAASPAAGEYIGVQLIRDGSNVADTLGASLNVLGFLAEYTADM